jgi:WD40 repeat protein
MARRQASGGEQVLAVSCSYDKSVKLWDVSSARAKQLAVLSGHAAPVLELAVAGDGSTLLTGDSDWVGWVSVLGLAGQMRGATMPA